MSRKHSPTDDLQALRAVLGRGLDLTTSERIVMAALILHRNGKTGRCDPSTYGMAEETGQSRHTVMRAIESLEERGLVSCSRRNGARTSYTLHPPTGSTEQPVAQSNRSHGATTPVAQSNRTGSIVQPERTNTNEERTNTPAGELWPVFVEEMDGERLTFTKTRRKRLQALHAEQLSDHDDPVAVFRSILRAVQASDHHMSERAYQMPESLFRNEERRERWTLKALENGNTRQPETGHGYQISREELWAEVDAETPQPGGQP